MALQLCVSIWYMSNQDLIFDSMELAGTLMMLYPSKFINTLAEMDSQIPIHKD